MSAQVDCGNELFANDVEVDFDPLVSGSNKHVDDGGLQEMSTGMGVDPGFYGFDDYVNDAGWQDMSCRMLVNSPVFSTGNHVTTGFYSTSTGIGLNSTIVDTSNKGTTDLKYVPSRMHMSSGGAHVNNYVNRAGLQSMSSGVGISTGATGTSSYANNAISQNVPSGLNIGIGYGISVPPAMHRVPTYQAHSGPGGSYGQQWDGAPDMTTGYGQSSTATFVEMVYQPQDMSSTSLTYQAPSYQAQVNTRLPYSQSVPTVSNMMADYGGPAASSSMGYKPQDNYFRPAMVSGIMPPGPILQEPSYHTQSGGGLAYGHQWTRTPNTMGDYGQSAASTSMDMSYQPHSALQDDNAMQAPFVPAHAHLHAPHIRPGPPNGTHVPAVSGPALALAPVVPPPVSQSPGRPTCTQPNCSATFSKDPDRIRHESGVHGINRPLFLCHIPGCIKSYGAGYTRKDKLVEHLYMKHGNLGFVKRT